MNTFLVDCPHCQQPIECDDRHSGAQVSCPSCQGELVVPESDAPPTPASKLTVSIAPHSAHHHSTYPGHQVRRAGVTWITKSILVLMAAAVVVTMVMVFIVPSIKRQAEENRRASGQTEDPAEARSPGSPERRPLVAPVWTLDLDRVKIPNSTANGSFSGSSFTAENAFLITGGPAPVLSLSQGGYLGRPYEEIRIQLDSESGDAVEGKRWSVSPGASAGGIKVVRRWKTTGALRQETCSGYVLKLEMGSIDAGVQSGKVYLSLADTGRSVVAGSFEATVGTAAAQAAAATAASQKPGANERGPIPVGSVLKQRARGFGADRRDN